MELLGRLPGPREVLTSLRPAWPEEDSAPATIFVRADINSAIAGLLPTRRTFRLGRRFARLPRPPRPGGSRLAAWLDRSSCRVRPRVGGDARGWRAFLTDDDQALVYGARGARSASSASARAKQWHPLPLDLDQPFTEPRRRSGRCRLATLRPRDVARYVAAASLDLGAATLGWNKPRF
jgi:hypothetical protein